MLVQATASGGEEKAPPHPELYAGAIRRETRQWPEVGLWGPHPVQRQSSQQNPAAPAPDVAAPALPAEAPDAVHHQPHPPPLLGSRHQVPRAEQQGRPQGCG